jgi:hypothetical protein
MAYYPTSGALRLPAAQVHRQIIDLDLLPSDIDQSFCHDNDPLFVAVGPDAAAQEWRAAFGRQADLYILLDEDHYANGGSSVPEREQRATEWIRELHLAFASSSRSSQRQSTQSFQCSIIWLCHKTRMEFDYYRFA